MGYLPRVCSSPKRGDPEGRVPFWFESGVLELEERWAGEAFVPLLETNLCMLGEVIALQQSFLWEMVDVQEFKRDGSRGIGSAKRAD